MELAELLSTVELFDGLNPAELEKLAAMCFRRTFQQHEVIARPNNYSDECFIIQEGFVEVEIEGPAGRRVQLNLGPGQTIGEIALVDEGPRLATLRAASAPAVVQIIPQPEFAALCEQECRIGYIVMRNIAADLAFRLRQRRPNDLLSG
jgi:CRP-like cAMP-binding protein